MYVNEEERNDRKKELEDTREVALTNDKNPQIHLNLQKWSRLQPLRINTEM